MALTDCVVPSAALPTSQEARGLCGSTPSTRGGGDIDSPRVMISICVSFRGAANTRLLREAPIEYCLSEGFQTPQDSCAYDHLDWQSAPSSQIMPLISIVVREELLPLPQIYRTFETSDRPIIAIY